MRKSIIVGIMCFLLVCAVALSMASAQVLNGAWFKLKISAKGHTLDPATGEVKKANFSDTVYLGFGDWNPANESYPMALWTLMDAGWGTKGPGIAKTIGAGENFISDFGLDFYFTNGDFVKTYHTPYISIKLDGLGALKKASWDGTGEIMGGSVGGLDYYGYFNLKGNTVSVDKLPFVP